MHLGAAPFSIYFSNPVEQILPLIENSEARVVFTQPQFVADHRRGRASRPATIEHIIVVEPGKVRPDPRREPTTSTSRRRWRAVGPGRHRGHRLHVGHDRRAQGRRVVARRADRQHARAPRARAGRARRAGWSPTCRWRTWPSAS